MKSLDAQVKTKNLIFLNELGLDPGIDHLATMKIVH
jgi:saccharopine dehydrogenase-like NADP-dependent oxidoreductase